MVGWPITKKKHMVGYFISFSVVLSARGTKGETTKYNTSSKHYKADKCIKYMGTSLYEETISVF